MSQLSFHGPLSQARAARLTERLTRNNPGTVLDIGCGWGELMLRILAATPDSRANVTRSARPRACRPRAVRRIQPRAQRR